MLRLPIYSKKEMLMMFEYGMTLSNVAKEMDTPLTTEIVKRCEDILLKELKLKGWKKVTLETLPNILAAFETK